MANETWTAGEIATAAKLNRLGGTGAYTSFTPTLTQGASTPTKTVEYALYKRRADFVHYAFSLGVTSAGTAGSAVLIGLPPLVPIGFRNLGVLGLFDAGVGWYVGQALWQSSTTFALQLSGVAGLAGQASGGFAAALASGDVLTGNLFYPTSS